MYHIASSAVTIREEFSQPSRFQDLKFRESPHHSQNLERISARKSQAPCSIFKDPCWQHVFPGRHDTSGWSVKVKMHEGPDSSLPFKLFTQTLQSLTYLESHTVPFHVCFLNLHRISPEIQLFLELFLPCNDLDRKWISVMSPISQTHLSVLTKIMPHWEIRCIPETNLQVNSNCDMSYLCSVPAKTWCLGVWMALGLWRQWKFSRVTSCFGVAVLQNNGTTVSNFDFAW